MGVLPKLIKAIDLVMARAAGPARSGLTAIGLHALWPGAKEAPDAEIDPFQPFSTDDLDRVIRDLKRRNFAFVRGSDLLDPGIVARAGRQALAWLTFDDGYANNLDSLPVLRRHGVPATFFISSGHVESGEAFWWDVLYREGRARGLDPTRLAARREALKALPPEAIRAALVADYGEAALRPAGRFDRPMTAAELAGFAAEPLVEIGNHTRNHAILSVLSEERQAAEIAAAQADLLRMTGAAPRVIAYPNGNYTAATLRLAAGQGLSLGVTCHPARTGAAGLADAGVLLQLGRHMSLRSGVLRREIDLTTARLALGAGPRPALPRGAPLPG